MVGFLEINGKDAGNFVRGFAANMVTLGINEIRIDQ